MAGATLLAAPGARAAEVADRMPFRRDPPAVESISLTLVDQPTSRFRASVRFAPDPRLGDALELDLGDGPTRFSRVAGAADEFAGPVTLDPEALLVRLRELRALERRLGRPLEVAIVEGRTVLGTEPLPRFPWGALFTKVAVALPKTVATADEVAAERSLLVVDPSVTGDTTRTWDPCTGTGTALGPWTFGKVMQRLASEAGATDAAGFVRHWLAEWEADQTINGWTVPKRDVEIRRQILDPWPRVGGTPSGPLDLARAPFRLLAIVNRIDLADNMAYGSGSGSAGEVRFVFGAVRQGRTVCVPLRMTVIVEMAIRKSGCKELQKWAQSWIDLGAFTLPDAAYNAALEKLVEEAFVPPNGLGQVRTNEIDLTDLATTPAPVPWELREFRLGGGVLDETTVAQTPGETRNRQQVVADYVNAFAPTIVVDKHVVPAAYPALGGTAFLGARALVLGKTATAPATFWTGPTPASITDPEARHHFSLNTCSGCHGGETETEFTHVNPLAPLGAPTQLSAFLTGVTPDPITGLPVPFQAKDPETPTLRHFDDLLRRRQRLAALAQPCVMHPVIAPMRMVH